MGKAKSVSTAKEDNIRKSSLKSPKEDLNSDIESKIYSTTIYTNKSNFGIHTPFVVSDSSSLDPTLSLEVFRHKNFERKPKAWKISGSTPFVKYESYNQGHIPSSYATKYAIAIVDEDTKEVSWVEAPFFHMATHPINIDKTQSSLLLAAPIVSADAKDRKRIADSLGESFGTRKRKQVIKSIERDTVHFSTISFLESSTITAKIDKQLKKKSDRKIDLRQ